MRERERERERENSLKRVYKKNLIENFTTYYIKKKKFIVFVLFLHHKHCATFAPKIYNCIIKN